MVKVVWIKEQDVYVQETWFFGKRLGVGMKSFHSLKIWRKFWEIWFREKTQKPIFSNKLVQ